MQKSLVAHVIANAEFNRGAVVGGSAHVDPSKVAQLLWFVAMQKPAAGQATLSNDVF